MKKPAVMYCFNCGATLNTEINRPFVFCQYCGSKNNIETEEMKTTIRLGNIDITAKTEIDNLIASAEYAIGLNQFDKANEILMTAIISGGDDYRVHICRAMIALHTDRKALLPALNKLKMLEAKQSNNEVTLAIKKLVIYKGRNGITALHVACLDEEYDIVVFCVEHGSDVNVVAGNEWCLHCDEIIPCAKHGSGSTGYTKMQKVTPISIMFEKAPKFKLDGTPFDGNVETVKKIRDYLMQHGAKDVSRWIFKSGRGVSCAIWWKHY